MARRRRRAEPGRTLLIQAVTVWFLWLCLSQVPHVGKTFAALAVGLAWGLLCGWRFRGRVERTMRRLVRRALWYAGVELRAPRGRRR
ncbi:MAG: hypothetical protein ACRDP6_14560 [Actinoallomurus sp.]